MNRAAVAAIARKDLQAVVRNRGVRIPLLVTPVILLVVLPILLTGGGDLLAANAPQALPTEGPVADSLDLERWGQPTAAVPPQARWSVFVLEVFLAPLYLLVPLIVATVIAADSFAGERERGTLEALLHTATTDRDLLAAKFLSAWLPAVAVAWVSFLVYSALANALTWSSLQTLYFPTPTWLLLALWVAPALSAFGLGFMVVASSMVRTLQAAHQVGSLLVLPVVLLFASQVTGALVLDVRLVAALGLVVWLLAGFALWAGAGVLRRQRLAERM